MEILAVILFIVGMALVVDGSSGSRSKWGTGIGLFLILASFATCGAGQ